MSFLRQLAFSPLLGDPVVFCHPHSLHLNPIQEHPRNPHYHPLHPPNEASVPSEAILTPGAVGNPPEKEFPPVPLVTCVPLLPAICGATGAMWAVSHRGQRSRSTLPCQQERLLASALNGQGLSELPGGRAGWGQSQLVCCQLPPSLGRCLLREPVLSFC